VTGQPGDLEGVALELEEFLPGASQRLLDRDKDLLADRAGLRGIGDVAVGDRADGQTEPTQRDRLDRRRDTVMRNASPFPRRPPDGAVGERQRRRFRLRRTDPTRKR
jgi:hypothetical protein